MPNREIVLLQMGGPATLSELRPFYERLFGDPDLIRLPRAVRPLQPALARLIAPGRAAAMRQRYRQIGGGSPLVRHTRSLAAAVEAELNRRGKPTRVHVAMRYSEPVACAVAADLHRRGVDEVALLPLYPHFSESTTGSSLADFVRAARSVGYTGRIRVTRAWGEAPGYLKLLVERIDATRSRLAREWGGPIHLLLSAHGLPLRYVEQGDDYPRQVRRTAEALATLLPEFAGWRLGYQSRMGPVHWLQPSTHTVLERLAAEGARAIVAVPLGFVSDHIETLYDLDILYRDEAVAMGIRHYRRVPSFNADPGFAALIADLAGACDMELTGQHSVPASRAGKDRQGWSDDD